MSTVSHGEVPISQMDSEPEGDRLPGYTPRVTSTSSSSQASHTTSVRNARSEYTISREDHKGRKWLFLSVKSRAPTPDLLPLFYGGDLIPGSVTLDILKPESFKSIVVKVTAGTILTGQEEHKFLVIEKVLWSSSTDLSDGSKASKLEKGRYVWSFEFTLPETTEVMYQKEKGTFPLPPSFTERASPAYINYRITVLVRRGPLGTNQSLFTDFAYIPITRPDLPSPLIQMAYTEGISLVGPEVDPEGWHTLPPTSIIGTLFDTKPVNVDFTLAITKPLSYACGSAMPLRLIFMGTDEQALDVLSSPYAANIFLKRSLDPGTKHARNHKFVQTIARAVFWPSKNPGTTETRVLEGEIKLKKTLHPSIVFPRFTVKYYLEILPFKVTGFVHAHVSDPLITQPVNVTSFHATGIIMRSFAPPEYAQEQHENYGDVLALLGRGPPMLSN